VFDDRYGLKELTHKPMDGCPMIQDLPASDRSLIEYSKEMFTRNPGVYLKDSNIANAACLFGNDNNSPTKIPIVYNNKLPSDSKE
jgi:hypothetical protein